MSPLLKLIVFVGFMSGLAVLLFGAPFVPPFRPVAVNVILILITLGNIFVAFVITATLLIYRNSPKDPPPPREDADCENLCKKIR